jgi:hypothetical protein
MKHVKLPVYDGEGMETGEHLEVSTALFEYLASISVSWKDHVKLVQGRTPAQEVEMLEDIIHGKNAWVGPALARTDKTNPWREYNKREHVGEFAKPEAPVDLIDEISSYPLDEWREIPGFSKYLMHGLSKLVREKGTDKDVTATDGRLQSVLLMGDEGRVMRMSVKFLFNQTFPEYKN